MDTVAPFVRQVKDESMEWSDIEARPLDPDPASSYG